MKNFVMLLVCFLLLGAFNMMGQSPVLVETFESLDGTPIVKSIISSNTTSLLRHLSSTSVVSLKLCVNRLGNVTFIELVKDKTNVDDKTTLRKFMEEARDIKFNTNHTAAKEECFIMLFKSS